jgi:hypothetical protein
MLLEIEPNQRWPTPTLFEVRLVFDTCCPKMPDECIFCWKAPSHGRTPQIHTQYLLFWFSCVFILPMMLVSEPKQCRPIPVPVWGQAIRYFLSKKCPINRFSCWIAPSRGRTPQIHMQYLFFRFSCVFVFVIEAGNWNKRAQALTWYFLRYAFWYISSKNAGCQVIEPQIWGSVWISLFEFPRCHAHKFLCCKAC